MKYYKRLVIFILFPLTIEAQQDSLAILKETLSSATDDSTRYHICRRIYDYYEETNRDSGFYYAAKSLELSRKNNKKLAEIHSLDNIAYQLIGLGRYAEALQSLLEAFKIAEDAKNDNEKTWQLFSNKFSTSFSGDNRLLMLSYTHHIFGILSWQTDNNDQALAHFRQAREISLLIGHTTRQMMADMNLGRSYMVNNQLDSALLLENEAEQLAFKSTFKKYLGQVYSIMAGIYQKKNDPLREKQYYYKAVQIARDENNLINLSSVYFVLTKFYLASGEKDSSLYYSMKNLQTIRQLGPVAGLSVNLGTVYENIFHCYQLRNEKDSLFKYQGLTLTVKDSLYKTRIKNLTEFQNVILGEQLRLQNTEKEKVIYQNKVKTYFMLAGIGFFLLLAIIFYRNNRQKQKANIKIEKAYDDLKATQQQLIQAEKMASLGELTAGIAHEIQNPLNFVNNFSDVNKELLIEMKDEIIKGNLDDANSIADDVIANEEKINHHGKRADAIVKGMLQHSRSSSGLKEPTDINALVDEYLRLAYHGLRAKDNSFNATIKTDFDSGIGNIKVIPQDIGRVILNLLTNAFYAVDEKRKMNPPGYEPTVSVSTSRSLSSGEGRGEVKIIVKDNGNGIPQKVLDKIFQPFFTTKPTGQGTGLGLSLSYDIIKAHGGELKVETQEGQGAGFVITLPL
jgi:signal transduction histidine kinase